MQASDGPMLTCVFANGGGGGLFSLILELECHLGTNASYHTPEGGGLTFPSPSSCICLFFSCQSPCFKTRNPSVVSCVPDSPQNRNRMLPNLGSGRFVFFKVESGRDSARFFAQGRNELPTTL